MLIVQAECVRPVTELQLPGVYGFYCEGRNVGFSVDAAALNTALKKLTEYETVSLHCALPVLEDIFLHYYTRRMKPNESKPLCSNRKIVEILPPAQ